jgi:hypothetical protein
MKVALGLLLMLAVLTVLTLSRSTRRAWLLVGVLLLALFWAACNISTQKITGTLAGSYAFSLTGSYAATGTLQHTVQPGLIVN